MMIKYRTNSDKIHAIFYQNFIHILSLFVQNLCENSRFPIQAKYGIMVGGYDDDM